jgi:transmembrane sensor
LGDLAENEDARQDYAALWRLLHRADTATDAAFSADAAWEDLTDGLDGAAASPDDTATPDRPSAQRASDRSARSSARRRARTAWSRPLAVAAAVTLCVVLSAVLWWRQPVTIQTTAGEQTTVTLPDGSIAELNGATTLAYTRGFSSLPGLEAAVRRVTLRGEAFFSVQPAARPFRVETPNAAVEVLGTAFNVRARPESGTPVTDVALRAGRVRFRAQAAADRAVPSVTLDQEGEQSRLMGQGSAPTPPEMVDLKFAAAWRDGGFAVRRAPLPTVLRELEIQFGTAVRLGVPAAQTEIMTLHYGRAVRLEDILRDIAVIQGLRYQQMNDGYALVP